MWNELFKVNKVQTFKTDCCTTGELRTAILFGWGIIWGYLLVCGHVSRSSSHWVYGIFFCFYAYFKGVFFKHISENFFWLICCNRLSAPKAFCVQEDNCSKSFYLLKFEFQGVFQKWLTHTNHCWMYVSLQQWPTSEICLMSKLVLCWKMRITKK